ncbi:hemerythrin hhE cation binding domain-containing protein [Sporocytophaga myxococcoides]|uniref:Hemerythrin hhE cation binding domain-containing protein n=1 Tax=Sporocytophaga myxococcoides TaxID=153721 RepID=A0A098LFK9_9BACT|nr:hemerythrin domain-containing protein [Sporocytophaga myxococcoides]GAL85745.1 hemerythrin hhE cation binding domain-containing protein [Sporocytophaga myxococcoides]
MDTDRRSFIEKSLMVTAAVNIGGLGFMSACSKKENSKGEIEEEGEKEVSPPEDLMQEHGVLKRILLIYDTCRLNIINKKSFPDEIITNSANIIRAFIEDYHEKQEENYIFPRFQKANQLTDLVQVLLLQHQAGRSVTDKILMLSKNRKRTEAENENLAELLFMFNRMYSPHEAREDTVLFPAFRKIVSKNEYDSLGEEFEKNEQKLFGKGGFEMIVDKVADLEKSSDIFDLSQFTPKL